MVNNGKKTDIRIDRQSFSSYEEYRKAYSKEYSRLPRRRKTISSWRKKNKKKLEKYYKMWGKKAGKQYFRTNANKCSQKKRDLIKSIAFDVCGKKCIVCGYDKCIYSLDFHHVIPKNKTINIAFIHRKNDPNIDVIERTMKEAKKCVTLCKNCHNELHQGKNKQMEEEVKLKWMQKLSR